MNDDRAEKWADAFATVPSGRIARIGMALADVEVAAAVAAVRADLARQVEALREGRHPTNWNEALDAAAVLVRGES